MFLTMGELRAQIVHTYTRMHIEGSLPHGLDDMLLAAEIILEYIFAVKGHMPKHFTR